MSSSIQRNKPLPPFGKSLMLSLQAGYKPRNDIYVFVGFYAWQHAQSFHNRQTVLVLPFEADPQNYHWPVTGLPLLVFDTSSPIAEPFLQLDECKIRKIAYVLLEAGAAVVRVVLSNHELVVFKRGVV